MDVLGSLGVTMADLAGSTEFPNNKLSWCAGWAACDTCCEVPETCSSKPSGNSPNSNPCKLRESIISHDNN